MLFLKSNFCHNYQNNNQLSIKHFILLSLKTVVCVSASENRRYDLCFVPGARLIVIS